MKISAVILTKNEEGNIKKCLERLTFCDEKLVMDDYSQDNTIKIAKKSGAKIYKRKLNNDFSSQKNYALGKSKGDWILFIDADERVSVGLKNEIISALENSDNINGFKFKRYDFFMGKWLTHGEVGKVRLIRLTRKGKGIWKRKVHETLVIDGNVGDIIIPIKHYPHPSLRKFIESVDRWSSWHALANKDEGKKSSLIKICVFPVAHFTKNILINFGFLDGIHGFIFAIIMSFHSYLSWSKLWLIQRK